MELYAWKSMLTDQPKDGQKVLMQYKSFDFEEKKYMASAKDWFIRNVQCWLEKIEQPSQDPLFNSMLLKGGNTDKEKLEWLCKELSSYLLIKQSNK